MAHRDRVIASTALLLRVAAIVGLPVVVTRQYPKGLGDHADEIAAALREAEDAGVAVSQIDKVSFDCFAEPEFAEAISGLGREQLLVAGMETHICVCQTALAGLRGGYEMHVAADACCSREDDNHAYALSRLGTRGSGSDDLRVRGLRTCRRGRHAGVQGASGRGQGQVRVGVEPHPAC